MGYATGISGKYTPHHGWGDILLIWSRGPLVFCLVLSLFLSIAKGDQSSVVFSGVFCMVWIGQAAVTLQIKLLGGKMYYSPSVSMSCCSILTLLQLLFPVDLHHWLYSIPSGHCRYAECSGTPYNCSDTGLSCACSLVISRGSQYSGRIRSGAQPSRHCSIPIARVLRCDWLPLLHQLSIVH